MAIAQISKLIRRSVGTTPEGELTVALVPNGDDPVLELKIKGAQAGSTVTRSILELYGELKDGAATPIPAGSDGPVPEAIPAPKSAGGEFDEYGLFRMFMDRLATSTYEADDGKVDSSRIRHLAMVEATRAARYVIKHNGKDADPDA